mgnify:CR=1 FL=1
MISIELKSHFLRLYQIALSDGDFDILELKMLYKIAEERGIPSNELDKLFLSPINYEAEIPDDIETKIEYLYDFTTMILADEKVTIDEKNALKKYCLKFNFLEENIEDIVDFLLEAVKTGTQKREIIKQLNS